MQQLQSLYHDYTGKSPLSMEPLPQAGSNRAYVRFRGTDGTSLIGVVGESVDENKTFCYLSRHFENQGLPVPHILYESPDGKRYLQTDLGRQSLYDALKAGRENGGNYDETEKQLLRRTIRILPHFQIRGAEGLEEARLLSPTRFTRQAALFDLYYFKYCFLRATYIAHDETKLENEFNRLADDLTDDRPEAPAFLLRDFQARNVMLDSDSSPHLIDFQGGRLGPLQYDVASFLWQASARYPDNLRRELTDIYIDELQTLHPVDSGEFRHRLRLFALFRTLQVLGAYGFRGYFERKPYFLSSIPQALGNLQELLSENACRPYPYLERLLSEICTSPTLRAHTQLPAHSNLVLRIFSFSYKKGIPSDLSGNGGGYVFDCRSTHNPGRYKPYKQLTGLDCEVIRFLEEDGEIREFLNHIKPLAEAHVQRYLERGFTDLMFSFGCTGGQHRSVYSAQHLAEHLHRRFGVEIYLEHREQGIRQHFPAIKRS